MNDDLKSMLRTIASIVIGGAIVYFLFYKPNIQQTQISSSQYVISRMDKLEQLLMQNGQSSLTQQMTQIPIQDTSYKNAETWEIERGPNGFISKVRADRNAKVGRVK